MLAADLRRLAEAPASELPETIALDRDLANLARGAGPATAIDAFGARRALLVAADVSDSRHTTVVSVPVAAFSVDAVDLTRRTVVIDPADGETEPVGGVAADALDRFAALGLALTCADLVGAMRGAIDLACEYAAIATPVRRRGRLLPGRAASARRRARRDGGLAQRRVARRMGGRRARPDRRPRRRVVREGLLRPRRRDGLRDLDPGPRRDRQHLGVQGASLSAPCARLDRSASAASARACSACSVRSGNPAEHGPAMDFGDSPDEAAFRVRLRAWLLDNTPDLPASSTSDDYWAGQADWHRSLYDAGFFGLSWPKEIGGHELPTTYDVIVDDELAAAGAPPRPSLGYLVQGILHHGSEDIRRRLLPGIVNGSRPVVPGIQRARGRLGSRVAAHRRRPRRRRLRHHRPQGLDQLLRRGRLVPGPCPHRLRRCRNTRASRRSGSRCISPASQQRR